MDRPQADRTAQRVVVIGDEFLGHTSWEAWFRPGQVLDLRGTPLTPDKLPLLVAVLALANTRAVVLSTGSVDGAAGIVDLESADRTVDAFGRILRTLRAALPKARLVLQSLPPAEHGQADVIQGLNERLLRLCTGLGVGFLQLWTHFAQVDGSMNRDLVVASGKLNSTGFETWIEMLDQSGVLPPTDRPRRLPSPRHVYLPPHSDVDADAPAGRRRGARVGGLRETGQDVTGRSAPPEGRGARKAAQDGHGPTTSATQGGPS